MLNTLSLAYRVLDEYERAIETIRKSLEVLRSSKNPTGEAMAYKTLGFVQIGGSDFEGALASFRQGLEIAGRIDLKRIDVLCRMGIGQVLAEQERFEEALETLGVALERAEAQNEIDALHAIHREMSRSYQGLGKYQSALEHHIQYHEFEKKLEDNRSDAQVKDLQGKLQIEKEKREAAQRLREANEQLRSEIEERKRAEIEKDRLQQQLYQSQKMEAMGRLAGGVAHDFNNLLTIIMGYCEVLLGDLAMTAEHSSDLEQINEAAKRASELTQQLLVFSRKKVLKPRVVVLNNVIAHLEKMLRRIIHDEITLEVRLDEETGSIRADPALLEQVILNLALNAQDAMPDGGDLLIATGSCEFDSGSSPPGEIQAGSYCTIEISDTGCGIPQDDLDLVFEPFFTTKDVGKGTGLGLASVYGIVRQFQGTVEVASQLDKGSTFRIYLPTCTDSPDLQSDTIATAEMMAPGTAKILLVEDEEELRRLLSTTLRKRGYAVVEAGNGIEALELVKKLPEGIDLLITDMMMPRLNGADLARRLVADYPKIKMLFMSGYVDRVGEFLAELPPDSVFLEKPFSIGEFEMQLSALLQLD